MVFRIVNSNPEPGRKVSDCGVRVNRVGADPPFAQSAAIV